MVHRLAEKKIMIGVTGGVAVYKVCSLVNIFIKEGSDVKVIMTRGAINFIAPLTFQALTNHVVYTDIWQAEDKEGVEHITISHWPDIFVIAPATANIIAKFAHGIADDFLTTVILASLPKTKIVIAPAMNVNMWENPITQNNIKLLKINRRFVLVEPRNGMLACRDQGKGKIAENESIFDIVFRSLKSKDA